MILGNLRSSLSRELDRFFEALEDALPVPTDSALCQARLKVLPDAFCALNQKVVEQCYREGPIKRLMGFRLLTVDGSTLRLRGVKAECAKLFAGESGWDPDSGTPLARISLCQDILNKLTLDASIAPYRVSEQSLAAGQVQQLGVGDLLLLDRNYPCYRLLRDLENRDIKFCARIKTKRWTRLLGDFLESSESERMIEWEPGCRQRAECENLGIAVGKLNLRFVKIVLNTGEIEVLVTNFLDRQAWPVELMGRLYALRWGAEEQYKLSKIRSEIERWSGKSDRTVEQDFHGRILLQNLSSILSWEARPVVQEATSHCQYEYQVNRTRALSITRSVLYALLCLPERVVELFEGLTEKYSRKPCPIRPGRRYPRNFRPKADFSFPYKAFA